MRIFVYADIIVRPFIMIFIMLLPSSFVDITDIAILQFLAFIQSSYYSSYEAQTIKVMSKLI